jgi:hypothetical protein
MVKLGELEPNRKLLTYYTYHPMSFMVRWLLVHRSFNIFYSHKALGPWDFTPTPWNVGTYLLTSYVPPLPQRVGTGVFLKEFFICNQSGYHP